MWNRVTVNRGLGRTTRYYVDEFHLLLKGELASWSVEIWKETRQIDGGQAGRVQAVVLAPLRTAHASLSGINYTISTAEGAVHRLGKTAEQGRGKRERPSVRRQLAQRKAAVPALPGPDLRRKPREAEL